MMRQTYRLREREKEHRERERKKVEDRVLVFLINVLDQAYFRSL